MIGAQHGGRAELPKGRMCRLSRLKLVPGSKTGRNGSSTCPSIADAEKAVKGTPGLTPGSGEMPEGPECRKARPFKKLTGELEQLRSSPLAVGKKGNRCDGLPVNLFPAPDFWIDAGAVKRASYR
jgi:hypothetical protein